MGPVRGSCRFSGNVWWLEVFALVYLLLSCSCNATLRGGEAPVNRGEVENFRENTTSRMDEQGRKQRRRGILDLLFGLVRFGPRKTNLEE
mmetsp:Transcript_16484/g.37845  ORF Transcript_16484/g.37845 Transcript_16484/m.37845 type:complete len:90 (-) Transcript_16484:353-622(-)